MTDHLLLRMLEPGRDRALLERLWEATLGSVWPLAPGALGMVRDGVVAEARPGGGSDGAGLGMVGVDPAGSILFLLVAPDHRRQGLGTWLLEAGMARLAGRGATTVGLGSGGDDYIWPGVPDDLPGALEFFAARAGVSIEVMAEPERAEGLGVGTAMVARASELLRDAGTGVCHIGWTRRERFYARVGYRAWRRYHMARRSLSVASMRHAGGDAPPTAEERADARPG